MQRGFNPDPTYKLDPEIKTRVPPIYDPEALEFFLSALPEDARAALLDEFFTIPGAHKKSPPQFGGPGSYRPEFRDALRAVFAPLHRLNPELVDKYPFDESEVGDDAPTNTND